MRLIRARWDKDETRREDGNEVLKEEGKKSERLNNLMIYLKEMRMMIILNKLNREVGFNGICSVAK
jgi:hypothetical protein